MDTLSDRHYPGSMRFADFIAPFPVDQFMTGMYERRPLHLPRSDDRRLVLDWAGLNGLLNNSSHWSEANIRLIMNSRPIIPDLYMDQVTKQAETLRRANPRKIETFLAMGASLVANAVEDISPTCRAVTATLSKQFAGFAGANIYCSFQDVQAFASHCDLHEVFVIQCEGEKSWNIYSNRAAAPVEQLQGDDAQAMIDAAKGPVAMQVRMRPGDLLYIPRGFYHDALASSSASLHVTFGVAPMTGIGIFDLLQTEARAEEMFRAYLPDGRDDDRGLRHRLENLATRMTQILTSDRFVSNLVNRQRALVTQDFSPNLPDRPKLDFYARSDLPIEILKDDHGTLLRMRGGELRVLHLAPAAEWMLSRPALSLQELQARFAYLDAGEIETLLNDLVRSGIFYSFKPQQ